jgi:hypothetical protein
MRLGVFVSIVHKFDLLKKSMPLSNGVSVRWLLRRLTLIDEKETPVEYHVYGPCWNRAVSNNSCGKARILFVMEGLGNEIKQISSTYSAPIARTSERVFFLHRSPSFRLTVQHVGSN